WRRSHHTVQSSLMAKHPEGYSECTDDGVEDLAEFRCLTHGPAGESMSHRSGYFPLSVSLSPPMAFWTLPSILSALPSDSSLASPTALPTICLTAPLTCFADPTTRSLSMIFSPPRPKPP